MKTTKKIIIFIFILLIMFLIIPTKEGKVKANSNLVVVQSSSGSDLTYRNSSEKVYMLEEYNYPTSQLRACWVSTFAGDVPSYQSETQYKSAMNTVLDNMEQWGMNAMIYHVRTHNNALYNSTLNPKASWWSNVNFDVFDPLEWLIEECHKRGIEFHAWLNPYRISGNGTNAQNTSGSIPEANPANNWDNLLKVGNNVILDPGIPENRDFIVDTCMEIIENYDIDAIHFDDYFYISGADDTTTREKYNTENLSIGNFRRKQVDLFIEDLSNHIRQYNSEHNKCIQLGISPSNVYRNGSYSTGPQYDANGNLTSPLGSNTAGFAHYDDYLYSDTLNWINHEWIDYIMPQAYHPIEQTAASYAEVVRWWSWAVRYKKVNLYTGIGIYMAIDSPTYWQRHTNEVELQLLISGQYSEFKGASFYRYNYLLRTSNEVIADAVDTISNDFWKKRIPGAVLSYYAPLTAEVKVSNIQFVSSTKTISWDALNNVRGYIVYQVPKGETLNKNNINHIYEYTQSTSITITDTINYDYYIASVNLANETSETEYVNINLRATDVIKLIDELPDVVDYTHMEAVKNARNMYEKLSTEEKQKVTNLDKLVRLENVLGNYDTLEAYVDNYILHLDKHIKTNRILETPSNITLSYKNEADQNLYNIETGQRLKNYLATKEITLIATASENNISISKEFNVNIGLTDIYQTGLFYRNDPSAMGPDDEGEYGPSSSQYIGWSGHTVVIDTYVLYIAANNYYEITDATTIPRCSFVSVAGVYVNKTTSTISMTLGSAFESKSCDNDGYMIISNNQIKETVHGFDATTSVRLQSGEALVILRYLDNGLNGRPLTPVTKLEVGTKAYIDEENIDENEYHATIIINKINAIQTPITLEQEEIIKSIKTEYDNSSKEVQTLVTNYDTLLDYLVELSNLKAEMDTIKYNSIQTLENYLNQNLYSVANQQIINQFIEEASSLINHSSSKTEINEIVKNYKLKLDEIPSIQEELEPYKKEKLDAILDIDYTLYNEEGQTRLKNIIDDAIAMINQATSKEEIDQIYADTQNNIGNVKTIIQLEQELSLYKEEQIENINHYVDQSLYSDFGISKINQEIDDATVRINQSTTKEEIDEIVRNCKTNLDSILTYSEELSIKKEEYLAKLDVLVTSYDVMENVLEQISSIALLGQKEINEASTLEDVENVFNLTKGNIDNYLKNLEIAKNETKNSISNYLNTLDYVENEKNAIQSISDAYCMEIDKMATINEIEQLKEEFTMEVENYHLELEDQRKKATEELEKLILNTYTEGQKKYLNNVLKNTVDNIREAGFMDAIKQIQSAFENTLNAYISDMNDKIKEISDYLDTKLNEDTYITTLVLETKEAMKNKSTIQELDDTKRLFDTTLQNYLQTGTNTSNPTDNCNCSSAMLIYSFILTTFVCLFVVMKKYAFR